MDRRAARMTTNYSKDEKRKLSLSLSKTGLHRLCSGSCTNTLTHSHKHPHDANASAKKPAPIFFFFTFFCIFFRPIAPIHRHDILIGKRRLANSCSWRAHTRRMIARAGQLMSQDGGRTTVSVPWLVLAGRHQVPEQADGVVWSQEVWF